MAGIEIKGFEELKRNTETLSKVLVDQALAAAEQAAAEVIMEAVKAAAPKKTGQLTASVRIFKGKDKRFSNTASASKLGRLLIGPSKNTGYYGYFVEKGFVSHKAKKRIPPHEWFEPITKQVEERAQEAGRMAFELVLLNKGEK